MTVETTDVVTRAALEKEVAAACQEVELAQQDLDCAEDRLRELEAQLSALPPDGVDEELFYARRDQRQMKLPLARYA